jgi:hypothetical protein
MDLLTVAKQLAETSHIVQKNSNVLEKSAATTSSIVRNTLLGSGLGALAGGVGNVYLQRKLDKKKSNTLRDAILGALVGGGVGAGAGMIGNRVLGIDPDTVHNVNLGNGVSIPVTESKYQAASKLYDPSKKYEIGVDKYIPEILGGAVAPPVAALSRKIRGLPATRGPFEGAAGTELAKKMIGEGVIPHPSAIAGNPAINENLRSAIISKAENLLNKADANRGGGSRVAVTPSSGASAPQTQSTKQPVTNVKPLQGYAKDVTKAYNDYIRAAKLQNASPVDKQVALENLQKAVNEFNVRNGASKLSIDKVQTQAANLSQEQLKRYGGVNFPTEHPSIRKLNNILNGMRAGGLASGALDAVDRISNTGDPIAPVKDLGYSLYDRVFHSPLKELKDK